MNVEKDKDPGRDSRQKEQHVQSPAGSEGPSTFGNGRRLAVALAQDAWGLGMEEPWLRVRTRRSLNHGLRLDLGVDLALKAMGRYGRI